MKVWIITYEPYRDSSTIEAIYADRDAAIAHLLRENGPPREIKRIRQDKTGKIYGVKGHWYIEFKNEIGGFGFATEEEAYAWLETEDCFFHRINALNGEGWCISVHDVIESSSQ